MKDDLLLWLNRYLTQRFIANPDSLPDDECEKESKVILNMVKPLIEKALIKEVIEDIIEPIVNFYIPDEDDKRRAFDLCQAFKQKHLGKE